MYTIYKDAKGKYSVSDDTGVPLARYDALQLAIHLVHYLNGGGLTYELYLEVQNGFAYG